MATGATPWERLRIWPAWRGLEQSLLELEQLLRQIDESTGGATRALEAADQVASLLADPASLRGAAAPETYVTLALDRTEAPGDVEDVEAVLMERLDEIGNSVSDVPALLEPAVASQAISHALVGDLPRAWQAQLGQLVFGLRQMLQSAGVRVGVRKAAPLLDAPGPATDDRGERCHYVTAAGDDLAVVLPETVTPEMVTTAHVEVLYTLLLRYGPETAWLHTLLIAQAQMGARAAQHNLVYRALGLERRRDLDRAAKDALCFGALRRLERLRISVYRYALDGERLTYSRATRPLWDLRAQEHGQARWEERRGAVVARGEDWTLHIGVDSWPLTGHLGGMARGLVEHLSPRSSWLAPVAGILLTFASRSGEQPEVALPVRALVQTGAPAPETDLVREIRKAVRALAPLGWMANLRGWPGNDPDALEHGLITFVR